ncbi:MAG: phosphoglycerate dehydrogenase [Pseudomonadales bacterium]|jgi:D-3-phosphoglycerate dehydrogenase|nr:phosphoglycerate dehydrogenase [Pseudomonadales bacterium]
MHKVLTLNQIALAGLERFPRDRYELGTELHDPDAILVRSHALSEAHATPRLRAVARAGAGVNNIPVADYTRRGIVVFNTPGANANSVKEIVIAGMLLAARDLAGGMHFVSGLDPALDAGALHAEVEGQKKRFRGGEIAGKTLGVVGLGAIGSRVAEVGLRLGMDVLGYDPAISVDAAWRIPAEVRKMENLPSLLARSDYVSLHVPALPQTRGLIDADALAGMRRGAVLLNYARDEIVDPAAVAAALDAGQLRRYVSDFPAPELLGRPGALFTPHLGASTGEAEQNCAVMAADQLMDFLEHGNIRNSVNFPQVQLERTGGHRIAVINDNVPKMLGGILSTLADHELNIIDMLNKSRDEIAYNLIDIEAPPTPELVSELCSIEGVVNVRCFDG